MLPKIDRATRRQTISVSRMASRRREQRHPDDILNAVIDSAANDNDDLAFVIACSAVPMEAHQ